MCFCLITFEFEDGNQGSITHFFFFSSNMPSVREQTQPKKPTPNPDYVLDATKQNMPTRDTQAKNKKHLFSLDKPETSVIWLVHIY